MTSTPHDPYADAEFHIKQAKQGVEQTWYATTDLDYEHALEWAQIARGMLTLAEYYLKQLKTEQDKKASEPDAG